MIKFLKGTKIIENVYIDIVFFSSFAEYVKVKDMKFCY